VENAFKVIINRLKSHLTVDDVIQPPKLVHNEARQVDLLVVVKDSPVDTSNNN